MRECAHQQEVAMLKKIAAYACCISARGQKHLKLSAEPLTVCVRLRLCVIKRLL